MKARWQAVKDALAALGLALAVHAAFVGILVVGTWDWQPFRHEPVPVFVTLVDEGPKPVEKQDDSREREEAARQAAERQAEIERQRQAEAEQARQREEEAERQRQREEQQAAEQRRREQEQARLKAEEERREARKKLDEERRRRDEARQRELEELRRQREELERSSEEQRQRLEEMGRREEREETYDDVERDAERLRLASEDADENARKAMLGEEYEATIRELVGRRWLRPPTSSGNLRCNLRIRQIPGGEIVDANIESPCNADDATRRSLIAAVNRVGRLPYQGYEDVFERDIVFLFTDDTD